MKRIFSILLCMGLSLSIYAQQQQINDVNTPLHLLQPDYGFPYIIPEPDSVKHCIDRVLTYLEHTMPAGVDNKKLKRGDFRITSYEAGVLYAATEDAARYTGDQRYLKFVTDRLDPIADLSKSIYDSLRHNHNYDPQMRLVMMPGSLDDCGAMCAAFSRLSLLSGKNYNAIIRNYMNRVWKQYRIGDDRIFARTRPHYNTVWLDDMYMGIPALAWYGALHKDTASLGEAISQIRAFKRRMWMPESKLFRHGWVEEMNPHPFFPWGRANGWAILTLCQVLDAMKTAGYTSGRQELLALLRQHIEGLTALQDKTGMLHQLLNDPSSYLETSATAIYTYCMAHAISEGWIDPLAYGAQTLLAWNAVSTQINSTGQIENVCVGSGMGFDRAFYCYRPVHVMAAHGYGPVIWAGSEIIRMLKLMHPKMNDSAIHFYPKKQTSNAPIFNEQR